MDQGTLVEFQISDGRRFVERFAADGNPVQAAFWVKTEEEGIWTRQIPKEESWKTVIDAERLFEKIANAIRKDKGLEPVDLKRAVA